MADVRAREALASGALALGVDTFIDLQTEKLEDADVADVVFDVIGGDTLDRWARDEFAMQPDHVIDTVADLRKVLGI